MLAHELAVLLVNESARIFETSCLLEHASWVLCIVAIRFSNSKCESIINVHWQILILIIEQLTTLIEWVAVYIPISCILAFRCFLASYVICQQLIGCQVGKTACFCLTEAPCHVKAAIVLDIGEGIIFTAWKSNTYLTYFWSTLHAEQIMADAGQMRSRATYMVNTEASAVLLSSCSILAQIAKCQKKVGLSQTVRPVQTTEP